MPMRMHVRVHVRVRVRTCCWLTWQWYESCATAVAAASAASGWRACSVRSGTPSAASSAAPSSCSQPAHARSSAHLGSGLGG